MKWIKKIRTENGLTQEEFANQLSYSRALIAKWETGERHPNANQINHICKLFDIKLDKYIMKDGFKELIDKQRRKVIHGQIFSVLLLLIGCGIIAFAFVELFKNNSTEEKVENAITFIFSGIVLFASFIVIKSDFNTLKDERKLKVLILKQHMSKEEIEDFDWSNKTEINIRINNLIK